MVTGPRTGAVASCPLSSPQRQLWLVEQSAGTVPQYNELRALRITGEMDLAALQEAISLVVARHEALRTTVGWAQGGPVQVIHAARPRFSELSCADLTGHPDGEAEAARQVLRFAEAAYDLTAGPLARWLLVRLGAADQVLAVGVHHIACDGFSMNVVVDEIASAYRDLASGRRARLPPVVAQYRDFAAWENGDGEGQVDGDLRHWLGVLGDAPTVLELAAGQLRPRQRTGAGRQETFPLPAAIEADLGELARRTGGTPFSVLLAAFAALVHHRTGRSDILLGTGAPGRPGPRFDRAVGFFASVLPVRLRPSGDLAFDAFAEATADALFDAFEHQHVPFPRLVEALDPERDPSVTPLIQVVFTMWDAADEGIRFGNCVTRPYDVARTRSRFDLAVEVVRRGGHLEFRAEYDTALLGTQTVAGLAAGVVQIIRHAATSPGTPLAAIPVPGQDGPPVGRRVQRGSFEVPLDAVEAALAADPRVIGAAVAPAADGDGLVAYVAAHPDLPGEALPGLAAGLPRYARPAAFAAAPVLYRHPDGAPDLARLGPSADPPMPAPGPATRAGPGALTAALCATWSAVLGIAEVTPDDNFFSLGGHSVLATELARRLSTELGVRVGVMSIFESPTVAELAAELAAEHPGLEPGLAAAAAAPAAGTPDLAAGAPARPGPGQRHPPQAPLSSAQLQLWVNERMAGHAGDFIAAVTFRIRGPLDASALTAAFQDVTARHPALRASVHREAGLPVQRFATEAFLPVETADTSAEPEPLNAAHALARDRAVQRFDLATAPLARVLLTRLGPEDWLLLLVQHHLITDATSMRVLTSDLGACYAARLCGEPAALPPPRLDLASYVAWEARWLDSSAAQAAEQYWRQQLAGAAPLSLTAGQLPGARSTRGTRTLTALLRPGIQDAVTACAIAARATPFAVVTAAYATMLQRWSGQPEVLIGTTLENRDLAGLEDVLGCFVNSAALRLDCSGDPAFAALVERASRAVRNAHRHQQLPFNRVVHAVCGWADPRRMPLFQVTSDWVDHSVLALALAGCVVTAAPLPMDASRYELSLYSAPREDGLELALEYATELWPPSVIEERLAELAALLAAGAADPSRRLSALPRSSRPGLTIESDPGNRTLQAR